jgi:hypothetical protein
MLHYSMLRTEKRVNLHLVVGVTYSFGFYVLHPKII